MARKRTIDSVIYDNSSDLPLFSSDDASASLDDYARPRPKKFYKGSWWLNSPQDVSTAQSEKSTRKRGFVRNYDSGVWMGSESSEVDVEPQTGADEGHDLLTQPVTADAASAVNAFTNSRRSIHNDVLGPRQQNAQLAVQKCVEDGVEVVDLAGLGLNNIPWSVLEPIKYMTREPPSSGSYVSLEPKLRLYLAGNNLSKLPDEMYGLKSLTTLSIRQNNISELSSAISLLTNLEDLNVSANCLHYLPYEILELTDNKLQSLRLHPNLFFKPTINNPYCDPFARGLPGAKDCKAVSRVAYLDNRGRPLHGVSPSTITQAKGPMTDDCSMQHIIDEQRECFESASGVPSLYEHALRLCSLYPSIDALSACLAPDPPPHLLDSLARVRQSQAVGGFHCSVCGRDYLVPRTEWIEWWTGLPDNAGWGVPLLRRGCSWRCLPNGHCVLQWAEQTGWTADYGASNVMSQEHH